MSICFRIKEYNGAGLEGTGEECEEHGFTGLSLIGGTNTDEFLFESFCYLDRSVSVRVLVVGDVDTNGTFETEFDEFVYFGSHGRGEKEGLPFSWA